MQIKGERGKIYMETFPACTKVVWVRTGKMDWVYEFIIDSIEFVTMEELQVLEEKYKTKYGKRPPQYDKKDECSLIDGIRMHYEDTIWKIST